MTLGGALLTIERRHPEAAKLSSIMDDSSFYHIPGALFLMEYHHPFNGNTTPPLTNWEPSELILRSFNEIPRYDLHNLHQADRSPLVMSAAGHGGQGSSSTSPLFDMVAASQHLTVERLNYRTCAPECSTGLPTSRRSCATACCNCAEEGERLLQPANEFRYRDDSLLVETKLHSRAAAGNRERSKVLSRLSRSSRPDEWQPVQVDLDRKAAEVPESTLTSNHKILLAQLEESDQTVIDKILRDHFQNSSEVSEVEPGSHPHGIVCLNSSTSRPSQRTFNDGKLGDQAQLESTRMGMSSLETIVRPEPSGFGLPASQSTTLTSSHSKSAPSSCRPMDVHNNAAHGRNCNGESKLEGLWKPQKPSTPIYGLHLGPSGLCCARSARHSTVRELAMTANAIEQANVPKPKVKKKRSRVGSGGRESENQRITHIAVERNRRKQMNSNLAALQALMPSSFVKKPDQSSIIGGAVEFVKELEAILEFLQLKKRRHCQAYTEILGPSCSQFAHSEPSDCAAAPVSCMSTVTAARSPPIICPTSEELADYSASFQERFVMSSELFPALTQNSLIAAELKAESRSTAATVEVKVLGDNAIVHIITRSRANQLVKVIVTLESLYLTILNTRITSNKSMVLYTFHTQVGRECRMSVNQVAAALQHTFNLIHSMDDPQ